MGPCCSTWVQLPTQDARKGGNGLSQPLSGEFPRSLVFFDLLPLINFSSNDPLLIPALPTTLSLSTLCSSTLAPGAVPSCQAL